MRTPEHSAQAATDREVAAGENVRPLGPKLTSARFNRARQEMAAMVRRELGKALDQWGRAARWAEALAVSEQTVGKFHDENETVRVTLADVLMLPGPVGIPLLLSLLERRWGWEPPAVPDVSLDTIERVEQWCAAERARRRTANEPRHGA